ncbi:MAG: amidohydrolase family protein [Bryobacteraceae bacterium]
MKLRLKTNAGLRDSLQLIVAFLLFLIQNGGQGLPLPFLIRDVTVVDVLHGSLRAGMSVEIVGHKILSLTPATEVPSHVESQIIDAGGKFLIPGLWDMHVHIFFDPPTYFPLLLANGVTGIRDMGGPADWLLSWRRQVDRGYVIGPRMVVAGSYLDGPTSHQAFAVRIGTPDEARRAVTSLAARGVDFIKIMSVVPRETYFAVAREAHRQGIPFVGHVPEAVSPAEASQAGQKSLEHLFGILAACALHEPELRGHIRPDPAGREFHTYETILAEFSDTAEARLLEEFRRNGTWQTPTLTIWSVRASLDDPRLYQDPALSYVSRAMRAEWDPKTDYRLRDMTPADIALAKRLLRRCFQIVHSMQLAGVGILAGTDTPFPFCVPGFSLHDELELLVEAGLSPLEALQSATIRPAEFLGRDRALGTVEQGKIADLVLLDGNPLEDIRNTRKIAAVVVNGVYLPRGILDRMLAEVRK